VVKRTFSLFLYLLKAARIGKKNDEFQIPHFRDKHTRALL